MTSNSQESHTGQLYSCNWLADKSKAGSSLLMFNFLISSTIFQSSNYPVVLTRLSGTRSRTYLLLNLWKCQESNLRSLGWWSDTLTTRTIHFLSCIRMSCAPETPNCRAMKELREEICLLERT